jgi:peptidoglycan/LPS O-acetylase OafA/YrhL
LSDFTPLVPEMAVRALHHTWSLAVEEQFYLLWPLLIWMCPARWLSAVCVTLLMMVELARLCAVPLGASVAFVNYNIATRCDGLLVGAWLAVQVVHGLRPNPNNVRISKGVLGGALLVIVVLIATRRFSVSQNPNVWMQGLGMWAVAFGACAAVWLGIAGEGGRFSQTLLQQRQLAYVGRISYGLYLWHQPILIWAKERFGEPSGLREHLLLGTAVSAVSLLVAMLCFRYFELPILGLRSVFGKQSSARLS